MNKISAKEAIDLIKQNQFSSAYRVEFGNERIEAHDALLLGRNGIEVPEELIVYDDNKIDYSDIPPVTDNDIAEGKIEWTLLAEITLEEEIAEWLKKEDIDINKFAGDLIRNFYYNLQSSYKNKK